MTVELLDMMKSLADPVRLRIVRAISHAELSVAELVSVLQMPQSTISRHLKPLRDNELVEARRDGTSVFYRKGNVFSDEAFSQFMEQRLSDVVHDKKDRASIRKVIDARKKKSRDFFDKIAGQYSALTEPGGGYEALSSGMAAGFTGKAVADLGAGEGALSIMLAPYASRVTAVDLSPKMLKLVLKEAKEKGLSDKIQTAEGDLEALPLADASHDAAFLSQALHHSTDPANAIKEAARILKKKGQLILLDLVTHQHEWAREQWADQWLGFSELELSTWLEDAGLKIIHKQEILGSTPDLPVELIVSVKY